MPARISSFASEKDCPGAGISMRPVPLVSPLRNSPEVLSMRISFGLPVITPASSSTRNSRHASFLPEKSKLQFSPSAAEPAVTLPETSPEMSSFASSRPLIIEKSTFENCPSIFHDAGTEVPSAFFDGSVTSQFTVPVPPPAYAVTGESLSESPE